MTDVSAMNITDEKNTQRGRLWSMIQPPINGPIVPPILKPVVTIPNTRPNAPGGEAARTSMSRDGEIMPDRNPASAHRGDQQHRTQVDRADQQDQYRRAAETEGRDVAVPPRPICDHAAGQHADGRGEQERRQRQVRRRQRDP